MKKIAGKSNYEMLKNDWLGDIDNNDESLRPPEVEAVRQKISELVEAINNSTSKHGDAQFSDNYLIDGYYPLFKAIKNSGLNLEHYLRYYTSP